MTWTFLTRTSPSRPSWGRKAHCAGKSFPTGGQVEKKGVKQPFYELKRRKEAERVGVVRDSARLGERYVRTGVLERFGQFKTLAGGAGKGGWEPEFMRPDLWATLLREPLGPGMNRGERMEGKWGPICRNNRASIGQIRRWGREAKKG